MTRSRQEILDDITRRQHERDIKTQEEAEQYNRDWEKRVIEMADAARERKIDAIHEKALQENALHDIDPAALQREFDHDAALLEDEQRSLEPDDELVLERNGR